MKLFFEGVLGFEKSYSKSGVWKYRYGYQGKYAEKDDETGWNHFELREYDPIIGRWTTKDPEGQFDSPYVGMGNDPVNGVDPDGGYLFGLFGSTRSQRQEARRIGAMEGYAVSCITCREIKFSWYGPATADYNRNAFVSNRWDFTLDRDLKIGDAGGEPAAVGEIMASGRADFDTTIESLVVGGQLVKGAFQGIGWLAKAGPTFSQYKAAYWATRTKPIYQPIRLSNGKVFKVTTELHHRFIPQRWKWAPNWLKNNSFNLQPLNTIQHGIRDPYRFRFFPTEIKNAINNGTLIGY
ncbi:MAG: RHS repeat-associated core domain-containing protein [Cytophagales bacterium]|nr:RHS repeat-associated core domain-containing protein [Cytophagales bacterium]